ncbi:MAG: M48 family metallopeptidase [Thermoguttaceae bacterium]
MHLLLTLAVVGALVVAENSPSEPVCCPGLRLAGAAAGMLMVPLVALLLSVGTARQIRRYPWHQQALLRRFKRDRNFHAAVWLSTALGVLLGAGWPQLVRINWGLEGLFLLDELVILVPVLVPLVGSWAAFYEVDRVAQSGPCREATGNVPVPSRAAYLAVHIRHYLGILLVPVFTLLAVQDGLELWAPSLQQGAPAVGVLGLTILLLVILFPVLLRYAWQTRPLEQGPLRHRLERVARRAGLRVREILVWDTGGLVVNAAVAGMVPALRYVFLSDGLLKHLSEAEILAVFGHEIGHIRHGHLLVRGAALLAPVSLGVLVQEAFPPVGRWVEAGLISGGLFLQTPAAVGLLAGIALYMLAVFGPLCRLLERQADLFGCRTLGWEPAVQPVETFISALENLAVLSGIDRRAAGWQHASIARRVAFLKRVAGRPAGEYLLDRRLRLLKGLLLGALLSPLLCQVIFAG